MLITGRQVLLLLVLCLELRTAYAICDEGQVVERHCFTLYLDAKVYVNAAGSCNERHQTLVNIYDDTVNDVIGDMVQAADVTGAFIGLHRESKDTFMWTNGTALESGMYQNWETEPVAENTTLCAEVDNNGTWTPVNCDAQNAYICQRGKRVVRMFVWDG